MTTTVTWPTRPATAGTQDDNLPPAIALARFKHLLAALPLVPTLEIDRQGRRVAAGGVRRHLAAREHQLLSYLATRQGQIVARRELALQVWDQPDLAEGRTIDMHVARLRGKFHAPGLIRTVRGQGYQLGPGYRVVWA